jgi:hypothetical protein
MANVARFTGDTGGNKAAADVALDTIDTGMG